MLGHLCFNYLFKISQDTFLFGNLAEYDIWYDYRAAQIFKKININWRNLKHLQQI